MPTADDLIYWLHLEPLPREGGWYRETHRSSLHLAVNVLGPRYRAARSASTAISYLLTPDAFSALHRLPTEEVFHFYLGDPVEMLQIGPGPEDGGRVPDAIAHLDASVQMWRANPAPSASERLSVRTAAGRRGGPPAILLAMCHSATSPHDTR